MVDFFVNLEVLLGDDTSATLKFSFLLYGQNKPFCPLQSRYRSGVLHGLCIDTGILPQVEVSRYIPVVGDNQIQPKVFSSLYIHLQSGNQRDVIYEPCTSCPPLPLFQAEVVAVQPSCTLIPRGEWGW